MRMIEIKTTRGLRQIHYEAKGTARKKAVSLDTYQPTIDAAAIVDDMRRRGYRLTGANCAHCVTGGLPSLASYALSLTFGRVRQNRYWDKVCGATDLLTDADVEDIDGDADEIVEAAQAVISIAETLKRRISA